MGVITPIYLTDCLPGDIFKIGNELLIRYFPLATPVMHEIEAEILWFFLEDRIVYPEFEDFIAGRPSGGLATCDASNRVNASLMDYLGIPSITADSSQKVNAVPLAMYYKIYDDWFRNANFQDEKFEGLIPGENAWLTALSKSATGMLYRNWQKDQFTSALDSPQIGGDVLLPLLNNGSADVIRKGSTENTNPNIVRRASDDAALAGNINSGAAGILKADTTDIYIDPNGRWEVEINADAVAIRELRRAEAIQTWLERGMRGGYHRHTEYLQAYWNIKSKDSRLDRSEFIGSFKQPVRFSEIRSTGETIDSNDDITSPIGVLAGHGISIGGGAGLSFRCPDHGWLMAVLTVRPKTAYYQGIERMFQRETRYDYYFDDLARIGEAPVKRKEVFAGGNTTENNSTFGYMPQYYEYMYKKDIITAQMQGSTLNKWHLARVFDNTVQLNDDFLKCVPSKRIFADTSGTTHDLLIMAVNHITAARQVAKLATPSL